MSYDINDQFPTSVAGLKSKAKKIRRREGIPHHVALDWAAQQSGAQTYQHFCRLYGTARSQVPLNHEIILEQDWGEPQDRKAQRVALLLRLSRAVDDLPCRGIGRLPRIRIRRRKGNRFLIEASNSSQEEFARSDLTRVARTIQFVDATGLVPANYRSEGIAPSPNYRGMDHVSAWMNPTTGRAIHIDEPYINKREWSFGTFEEFGQPWCQENQYEWRRPNWAGMYRPEDWCDFILMSHRINGESLEPIVRNLEAYPPAILNWTANFIA